MILLGIMLTACNLTTLATLCLFLCVAGEVKAFSNKRNDNLAAYWGQNSGGHQQRLGFYCNDDTINAIPLSFLTVFFGEGGKPEINFSNICNVEHSGTFPGTNLANCTFMASDIRKCQEKGKIVTISLGGAVADVGFKTPAEAVGFAKTVWNMFLGGKGSVRPFGSAILDGVDLNIETGSPAYYTNFVNALRSFTDKSKKRYYVTAAPQCPFPDDRIGYALNHAFFDAVYVQFYNNYCRVSDPNEFNMDTWDHWAKTQSLNNNIKVYLGVSAAIGTDGHLSSRDLITVARAVQKNYTSFGGVMLWDVDTAYTNQKYHVAVKNAIRKPA